MATKRDPELAIDEELDNRSLFQKLLDSQISEQVVILIGVVYLFFSILYIIIISEYPQFQTKDPAQIALLLMFLFSGLLLVGISRKKQWMFYPWLVENALFIICQVLDIFHVSFFNHGLELIVIFCITSLPVFIVFKFVRQL